jgi:5-(carboxyamino)imidazole ribonucleotide synthase
MARVGILGGGQLGLMLAESLDRLGQSVVVLEPDIESPCAQRRSNVIHAPLNHRESLVDFFSRIDVATFDSENIAAEPLRDFAHQLKPSLRALEVTQNRALEKVFLKDHGFQPVQFQVVSPTEPLHGAIQQFGFPCIVKSTVGGYDGKGQYRLRSAEDLTLIPPQSSAGWVLEEVLELEAELSCVVARDSKKTIGFPVFENIHSNHILDLTVLPARLPQIIQDETRQVASSIANALDMIGLLTVEFFVGKGRDGVRRLYVNEMAPRVHNSGHVTRQACTLSQFDALARILAGIPVVQPEVHRGAWCMGQLLGDVWLAQGRSGGELNLSVWQDFPDVVDVYVYGKREARKNRKMGHFVVHGDTPERVLQRALSFRHALEGSPRSPSQTD